MRANGPFKAVRNIAAQSLVRTSMLSGRSLPTYLSLKQPATLAFGTKNTANNGPSNRWASTKLFATSTRNLKLREKSEVYLWKWSLAGKQASKLENEAVIFDFELVTRQIYLQRTTKVKPYQAKLERNHNNNGCNQASNLCLPDLQTTFK